MARKKPPRRHRLLVYYRLGQRWRTMPLLTALLGGALVGLGWLASRSVLVTGDAGLLGMLWEKRPLLFILITTCLLLYALLLIIARNSYVEARPGALHVHAGLAPLDISYGRIRQIRLVQVGVQFPPDTLKAGERALLAPLLEKPCTAVDLRSWPRQPLRKLWHRRMFTADGSSLLFIVDDPMLLNQQIDGAMATRQARRKRTGYKDPIERADEMARKQPR